MPDTACTRLEQENDGEPFMYEKKQRLEVTLYQLRNTPDPH
jgi:hypothetical protein